MANQMTQNYGANIWNEYIFLLKCNMARIWTQNVYFNDSLNKKIVSRVYLGSNNINVHENQFIFKS